LTWVNFGFTCSEEINRHFSKCSIEFVVITVKTHEYQMLSCRYLLRQASTLVHLPQVVGEGLLLLVPRCHHRVGNRPLRLQNPRNSGRRGVRLPVVAEMKSLRSGLLDKTGLGHVLLY
jgi:hypothetical protein